MRKIVLVCMAGLSTSILVSKMKEAAAKQNYACDINAYPIANVSTVGADADIVLLGPQVRFQEQAVKSQVKCPVKVIDMQMYGMMDGESVINDVKAILGD